MSFHPLVDKRIFLVEDSVANLAVTKTALEQYRVTVGYDRWGQQTLKAIALFGRVDMILLDLMFPQGVTGYDVYTEIRSAVEYATLPIVAVSASDPNEAIPRTKAMGFAGFISKPIHYSNFPAQLASIFEGTSVWDYGYKTIIREG